VTYVTTICNYDHCLPSSPLANLEKVIGGNLIAVWGKGGTVYEIDLVKCKGVGDCAGACPVGAIEIRSDNKYSISDDCTDCGACEPVCDAKAIRRVH